MLTLLVASLVILAMGQIAVMFGISFQVIFPESSRKFRVLFSIPIILLILSNLSLAYVAATGSEVTVLGLNGLALFSVDSLARVSVWWMLAGYGFYYYIQNRGLAPGSFEVLSAKADSASREAEDRFAEGELEKTEVRGRLNTAERKTEARHAKSELEKSEVRDRLNTAERKTEARHAKSELEQAEVRGRVEISAVMIHDKLDEIIDLLRKRK